MALKTEHKTLKKEVFDPAPVTNTPPPPPPQGVRQAPLSLYEAHVQVSGLINQAYPPPSLTSHTGSLSFGNPHRLVTLSFGNTIARAGYRLATLSLGAFGSAIAWKRHRLVTLSFGNRAGYSVVTRSLGNAIVWQPFRLATVEPALGYHFEQGNASSDGAGKRTRMCKMRMFVHVSVPRCGQH